MMRITGTKIRAGRASAHLSQDELAGLAGIHRDCLRAWEGSSDAVPKAQYRPLCRLIDVLEGRGVHFTDCGVGVRLERSAPVAATVHSEAIA